MEIQTRNDENMRIAQDLNLFMISVFVVVVVVVQEQN